MTSDKNADPMKKVNIRSRRKVIFIATIALLLLIPIIWAFVNAKTIDNKGFFGTQFEVALYDAQNNLIVSDSSIVEYSSARSAVSIFHKIVSNMQKTNANSINLSSFPSPLTADIKNNNFSTKYSFYFFETGTCYCFDQQGQAYTIAEQDSEAFMNSAYSETIYSASKPPLLATGNNETIVPSHTEWYYKNKAGNFMGASPVSDSSKVDLYEISGSLDISFEEIPDICKIKVYRDDALIFNGTYEDLSNMIIDTGTRLKVEISAEWTYDPNSNYYGKSTYIFNADINNYADFSVNASHVTPDGFVIISGSNVENAGKIEFSPVSQEGSLPYAEEAMFVTRGENVYCLLIFPSEWERGDYCFNITYGTFSKDFNISYVDAAESTPLYNSHKPFETIYYYTENEVQNEFKSTLNNVPNQLVEQVYFTDPFMKPEEIGFTNEYLYSTYISCEDGSLVYSSLGNRYYSETEQQTNVYSLNGGKVIYKGYCTFLGNFIVIEHGLGLRTWYCNLSHISAEPGSFVAKGEKIGRSGTHETSPYDGFLLLCSVYDTFVDINCCLDEKTTLQ